ncbi:hypothetical protein D9M69_530620 [compost metagenome]
MAQADLGLTQRHLHKLALHQLRLARQEVVGQFVVEGRLGQREALELHGVETREHAVLAGGVQALEIAVAQQQHAFVLLDGELGESQHFFFLSLLLRCGCRLLFDCVSISGIGAHEGQAAGTVVCEVSSTALDGSVRWLRHRLLLRRWLHAVPCRTRDAQAACTGTVSLGRALPCASLRCAGAVGLSPPSKRRCEHRRRLFAGIEPATPRG